MIKTILAWVTILFMLFACSDNQYTKSPKEIEHEIITYNGECWVIERSEDGLVKESIFHAEELDDCIQFVRDLGL